MLNEIITIYAITDDLLKATGHEDDIRREMTDAEIMTTALVGAMFFNGNHSKACAYMKDHKWCRVAAPRFVIGDRINFWMKSTRILITSNLG